MELQAILRQYLWLWVILGTVFVSVVISVIFILINKCICKHGKQRISQLQKESVFSIESNKYMETTLVNHQSIGTPPLPPRTQFLTLEAQSYENLAEAPEFGHTPPKSEEDSHDYEEAVPDCEQSINDYEQAMSECEEDSHDYEEAAPDYEEATDEQPDYVKVEPEEESFPPPPEYEAPDPTEDNSSTEDYDDIGEEEENPDEDYDDVA